jgi:hypothetical protein
MRVQSRPKTQKSGSLKPPETLHSLPLAIALPLPVLATHLILWQMPSSTLLSTPDYTRSEGFRGATGVVEKAKTPENPGFTAASNF